MVKGQSQRTWRNGFEVERNARYSVDCIWNFVRNFRGRIRMQIHAVFLRSTRGMKRRRSYEYNNSASSRCQDRAREKLPRTKRRIKLTYGDKNKFTFG